MKEHVEIIESLIKKHGNLFRVSQVTGIPYHTMYKLRNGKHGYPSIPTMDKLRMAKKVKAQVKK